MLVACRWCGQKYDEYKFQSFVQNNCAAPATCQPTHCLSLLCSPDTPAIHSPQGGPKTVNPKCSTHNFVKYRPILKKSFTVTICRKFAMQRSLTILPQLKCVAVENVGFTFLAHRVHAGSYYIKLLQFASQSPYTSKQFFCAQSTLKSLSWLPASMNKVEHLLPTSTKANKNIVLSQGNRAMPL